MKKKVPRESKMCSSSRSKGEELEQGYFSKNKPTSGLNMLL